MSEPAAPTRGIHVAVLAFPFGTHAAPLLAVTRRLAAAVPSTVRFSFFNTAKSNAALFSEPHNGNIKAYNVPDGIPDGYVFTGKPQEDIELFLQAAPAAFREGVVAAVAATGEKISCLVTDAFLWFAEEMAAEMDVPWVAFWTAGACSLSAHHHTDFIRQTVGIGDTARLEEQTLSLIPGMSKIRVKDLPEGVLFGRLDSIFSQMLHKMGIAVPRAAAVFLNSFEELDPSITENLKSKFKSYLNVGPFNLYPNPTPQTTTDTDACLSWLQRQRADSVAYISFGTVMTPPPGELLAIAEGLEDSNVPFIWSLKDKDKVHLPNGFLERTKEQGKVVAWAPQVELLAQLATGVFVTHCGWNSVLESIACGVPMICRPFFGDQRLNGRSVEDVWGIGVRIEGGAFTKEGISKCLDLLLVQDKGKKMREKVRQLKEQAQNAVLTNGSSEENFKSLLGLVSTKTNC